MRIHVLVPALLVGGLVGCAPPDEEASDVVPVVEQTIDRNAILQLREELRIDGNRDDAPFFNVGGAVLDSRRQMFVLDRGNREILVFDSVGNRVGVIGRTGDGPGEFNSPRAIWLSGDTLGVSDSGNRFHLFRTDGEHLATRAFRNVMDGRDLMTVSGIVATPEGWLTVASAFFRRDADGDDSSSNPIMRNHLLRIDWEGEVEATGYRLVHEPLGQMVGPFFVQPPYYYSPRFVVDGLGRVNLVPEAQYRLEVHTSSGELSHVVANDYPPDEITRADLEEWREARACAPGQPECDESRNDLALRMEIPDFKPVVGRLVGFPGGYVAVMRTGTDPDPTDRLSMGEYDLFSPEGRFLGRLPIGLSPRWFDGSTLLATTWDDMMVPSMVRYRVEM